MSEAFDRTPNASATTNRPPRLLSQPCPPPSRGSVADPHSSQHLEGMNHLSTLECQDRGGESGIVPNAAAVSDERSQLGLELLDRFFIHEQAENAPGETLHRLDAGGSLLEPAQTGLDHRRPLLILQCQ